MLYAKHFLFRFRESCLIFVSRISKFPIAKSHSQIWNLLRYNFLNCRFNFLEQRTLRVIFNRWISSELRVSNFLKHYQAKWQAGTGSYTTIIPNNNFRSLNIAPRTGTFPPGIIAPKLFLIVTRFLESSAHIRNDALSCDLSHLENFTQRNSYFFNFQLQTYRIFRKQLLVERNGVRWKKRRTKLIQQVYEKWCTFSSGCPCTLRDLNWVITT